MILAPQPKIFLSLKANDTTIIHRGGMTGLWMSLKVLEKKYPNPTKRPSNLSWNLTATSISLDWQGEDFPVLDWLLKQSFQLNEAGLITFTGLEFRSFKLINKIHNHKAINETFLRLNWFYQKRKVTSQSFKINNIQVSLKYKQLNSYAHQTFAQKLCDESGNLSADYIQIVSWLYPGATVRHARLNKANKIEEKVEYALALLFLPLVCQYYILQADSIKTYDDRFTRYVIVVPEVHNLEMAAIRCWSLKSIKYPDVYVANLAEAALNYYHYTQDSSSQINLESCQVLLYEKLNKKSQQRAIFYVQDFTITPQVIKDYQFTCQHFANNIIFFKKERKRKNFGVKVNLIRSIIANNLAHNLPWWTDFWENIYEANLLGDIEEQLAFNRQGLFAMIEEDAALEIYQNFIRAFHEALRKIYAKTYDEKKSKKDNQSRIEKKYESIRSELTRCYDQQSLEDFISDLISRAGWNGELREIWTPILPLIFQDIFWQKTRNLALIALASYQPQKKNFSLKNIDVPIKFWMILISINHQAGVFYLYKKSMENLVSELEEIFQEFESESQNKRQTLNQV